MKGSHSEDSLRCSFCHKRQDRVGKLISTPPSFQPRAYICDECIMVCYTILTDYGKGPGISFDPQTTPPVEN
jgi:ATP-dependent Clp protease ATP-binding subunit ClpX